MFSSAMTLRRLIRPPWMFLGAGGIGSCNTPSTRKRIRTFRSAGSMWTSEARSPTAWVMIALTSLTMGASSSAASICSSSPSIASAATLARASTWPSMPGELLDRAFDVAGGRDQRLDVAVRDRADVVERVDVRRVGHRHEQLAVAFADGDRAVPAGERFGEQRRGGGIDRVFGEVDEFEADLFGERPDEVALLDHAHVDQHAADRLGRAPVFLERLLELFRRDHAQLDQDLTELFRLALDRGHRRPRGLFRCGRRSPMLAFGLGHQELASSSSEST